jgi:hypothetical protein
VQHQIRVAADPAAHLDAGVEGIGRHRRGVLMRRDGGISGVRPRPDPPMGAS